MRPWAKISFALLLLCRSALAQGFVNLDFENPILPLSPVFNTISAANGIPGWTAYLDGNPDGIIGYNTISLAGSYVSLEDVNNISPLPIQGNYSVYVQGPEPGLETSAAIGQTGTIPNTAQSLTFLASLFGTLQVTFNGQNVPFSAIGSGANYTIYGANIASYAGQTGQLLFTSPVSSSAQFRNSALLDNIQFSSSSVPEPSEFALTALGALLLGFRRWRNFFAS